MFYTRKINASIYEWYKKDKYGEINFNPSYQRVSGLWSVQSKQLLIDSIFNSYDLPKFYISYFFSKGNILNEEEYLYAIIDGKQRFHAIFEFLDDQFATSKDFILYDYPDFNLANKTYTEIINNYPELRAHFEQYDIDIILVETDEQERIEELFLRLNEGKHLSNAEKRFAINGYLNSEIKEIVKEHSFFKKLKFKDKRYDYYDLTLKLYLIFENGFKPVSLNKRNLDKLVNETKNCTEELEDYINKFKNFLDSFSRLFGDNHEFLTVKSNIPIYYLFYYKNQASDWQILFDFLSRFEHLRKENRVQKEESSKNEILLEYDRLNQQGTTNKESLEDRLKIIETSYKLYLNREFSLNKPIPIELDSED